MVHQVSIEVAYLSGISLQVVTLTGEPEETSMYRSREQHIHHHHERLFPYESRSSWTENID